MLDVQFGVRASQRTRSVNALSPPHFVRNSLIGIGAPPFATYWEYRSRNQTMPAHAEQEASLRGGTKIPAEEKARLDRMRWHADLAIAGNELIGHRLNIGKVLGRHAHFLDAIVEVSKLPHRRIDSRAVSPATLA